jgi:two-component system cell cycle sensor histidine kinase/response regulator CckA
VAVDERLAEVLERTRAVYEWAHDLDRALQRLVDALVPAFADAVAVIALDPGVQTGEHEAPAPAGGRARAGAGDDGATRTAVRVPAEAWAEPERGAAFRDLAQRLPGLLDVRHPLMAWLARPRPVLQVTCPDLADVLGDQTPATAALVARAQLRSVLTVPLLRGGTVEGVLVFGHTDASGRRFGPGDLAAAREVALRCSALVETHRLRRRLAEARGDSELHRLQLEHLIDAMPDGFSLISPDLRYLQVNLSRARMQGLEPADLVGEPVARFTGGMADEMAAAVRHVLASGEVIRGREVAAVDVPGDEPHHLLVDMYPVRVGDEVLAVGTLVRDITDRVERERRQHALEEELAAARRLETVAQLAGGVAHDFNNILAVIGLRTELLLRQHGDQGELQESLETIGRAVDQGRELADQLLRVGRAERAPRERVDVDLLLADLAPVLEAMLDEGVVLDLRLQAAPAVEVPRSALQQTILNLVVNGRDAMDGRGRLTVTCRDAERGGRAGCELRVADTGPGMSDEVHDRAFEPFFTTKEVGVGAGLGLATVYGTAQAVGGRAWIERPPEGGCEVAVWIPAAAPVTAVAPQAQPGGVAAGARTGLILVVEDQPAVAAAVVAVLRELGLEAVVASDGDEALALAARTPPLALVIADVVMPGRSGPDLVAELRRRSPGLPALYVSGYTERRAGLGLGVADHELLRKPFTAAELAARVDALLA